jgi:hypothetical protein
VAQIGPIKRVVEGIPEPMPVKAPVPFELIPWPVAPEKVPMPVRRGS